MAPYDIVSFFVLPDAPNRSGFSYNDFFKWDDDTLELKHDYIQWLFPLAVPSECNGNAPVLTFHELEYLRSNELCRVRQRTAFLRMLKFFSMKNTMFNGIEFTGPAHPLWIDPDPTRVDHNYLRISRILASLVLFNNKNLAKKLFNCLMKAHHAEEQGMFPHRTREFWRKALNTNVEETLANLKRTA